MSVKSNSVLLLLSVFIGLVVLEIGVRSYDAARGFGFFSEHRDLVASEIKILPFRTFGFELYRNRDGKRYISSRHGELYPLQKSEGTFRVVVFGGSTTENLNVFRTSGVHYPAVMQQKLRQELNRSNIEVINVANSSYATPHSLILLALDVVSWQPDLIIVSHNINDLLASYWPNFTFDYSNKYGNDFYNVPDFKHTYTALNVFFQHSQLYWVLRKSLKRITNNRSGLPGLKRRSYGDEPSPVALRTFKRNIRSIVAIAKKNGIKVLLGTQALLPTEEYFNIHMEGKPYNHIVIYPLHEEFVSHHEAFNDAIVEVAISEDVYYIDNRLAISGDKQYFIDFVHYTAEGVEQLARNYVNVIIGGALAK